ncbi:MAG: hypothetical protein EOP13_14835 [Pseudomonas sp.]|uniref:hypothetical protein n=1 Tax=Pseudomonas sp. TaxID=306 RepID=UPI001229AAD6|nr:hypothetical protein [Pseudomonas sp.]RZI72506.1 MAG: hypothetical protein EOP13_14835 [Pseudomonas sp.]
MPEGCRVGFVVSANTKTPQKVGERRRHRKKSRQKANKIKTTLVFFFVSRIVLPKSGEALQEPEMVVTMPVRMDELDDEQLAATAYVWRQRAQAGDKNTRQTWARLAQELQRRLGPTPSNHALLQADSSPGRSWWPFW